MAVPISARSRSEERRAEERARQLVRERGALTLVPELVESIAGERVRGSWWSHPKGHAIFRIATKLEASPEILTAKLVDRKVTFLHERLWPALVRVVTDRSWRTQRAATCDDAARRLLTRVERNGRVPVEDRTLAKARKTLEAAALVRSTQEHTETGTHRTILESWRGWASEEVARSATELTLAAALAELRAHRIELSPT